MNIDQIDWGTFFPEETNKKPITTGRALYFCLERSLVAYIICTDFTRNLLKAAIKSE